MTLKPLEPRVVKTTTTTTLSAATTASLRAYAAQAKAPRKAAGAKPLLVVGSPAANAAAAAALAQELGLPLLRIDLASVVSRFIGETEKNLDRVFAANAQSGAVLFFDEADALFGKRSEVRDSHDRYANQEVSYLLQRIESRPGVAILASSMQPTLDAATLARFQSIVDPNDPPT